MLERKFTKKDFEEFIKFKDFDPHKFYVVTVGNDKMQPTMEIISDIAAQLRNTFHDMKFIIVPNYYRITGFEPIKSSSSD